MKYQVTNVDAEDGSFTEHVVESKDFLSAALTYYKEVIGVEIEGEELEDMAERLKVRDNGASIKFEQEILLIKQL